MHVVGYFVSVIIILITIIVVIIIIIIKFSWINILVFFYIYIYIYILIYRISNTFFYMYSLTRKSWATYWHREGDYDILKIFGGSWRLFLESCHLGKMREHDTTHRVGIMGRWEFFWENTNGGFGDYYTDFEENIECSMRKIIEENMFWERFS